MTKIIKINSREVLDSRGKPTIETDVFLECGAFGRAIIPSGASTGGDEALELRDKKNPRYNGNGVLMAISNVREKIAPKVIDKDAINQAEIDNIMIELDKKIGLEEGKYENPNDKKINQKLSLGANAILSVSLAVARAAADAFQMPLYRYLGGKSANLLPIPLMNFINGGQHADNNLIIQEFMIVPRGTPSFSEALRMGAEIFMTLKDILVKKGLSISLGDEGGFAPMLESHDEAFELLLYAIKQANYKLGEDCALAIDVAANFFYNKDNNLYYPESDKNLLKLEPKQFSGKPYTSNNLISYYEPWIEKYKLISIEDGLDENDWDGWIELTKRLGSRIQIVGDDLFVTNKNRLEKGIKKGCANAILVKLNQIGTLMETLDLIQYAKTNGYKTIISHRSGETEDTTIAHLAVAVNAGQIKTGSVARSERTAKYNELLRIEEDLGLGRRW